MAVDYWIYNKYSHHPSSEHNIEDFDRLLGEVQSHYSVQLPDQNKREHFASKYVTLYHRKVKVTKIMDSLKLESI